MQEPKIKWTRPPLGYGLSPLEIKTEVVYPYPNMDIPYVPNIQIKLSTYKLMLSWASLGRHADNLIRVLDSVLANDADSEEVVCAIEDIQSLKEAMMDWQEACRQHSFNSFKQEEGNGA